MAEFGVPTAGQLEKINALAKRPLEKEEVFVYPHKMAGDMIIPERYIQLTPSLLKVFVKNANDGVAFLLNHSWTWSSPKPALPYGRVFEGELSKRGIVEGETISFNGSTYIVRGQEKDGISTDSIISDIETGVLFDTSIGWGADMFECSICGNDVRDWRKCEHIPGRKYIVNKETEEVKLCWALAKPPGYLMEDSGVFDGAYPGAGTSLSVTGMGTFENEQGVFSVVDDFKKIPLDARVYGTYSNKGGILTFIKKADHQKTFAMSSSNIDTLKGGGKQVDNEVKTYTQEEVDALVKEATDKAVADAMAKLSADVQASAAPLVVYMTQQDVVDKLGKELPADKVLSYAKEGESYMNQLIDDAIAMGVRAQGNDFPAETWKNTFAGMGSQQIKDIMATFEKQAKEEIPAGRQTQAGAGKGLFSAGNIPDEAFKV